MKDFKQRILYVSGMMITICWSITLFAQNTAAKAVDKGTTLEVTKKIGEETLFDLILKGGYVMIPLGVCSLVALALFLERLILLRKSKVVPASFWPGMKEIIGGGKADLDKAFEYCVNSKLPIGNIIKVGIEKWRKGRKALDVEKAVEDAASREVAAMGRTLRGFKIVAGISPLLGLLGTVYGMIRTFQSVAAASGEQGQSKIVKLSTGIYEAMVTTATGLSIAIPVLLVYYFLNRKVDAFADDIEVVCTDFMDEYQECNK
jgi:biopolymer transport protein ExbB